MSDRWEAESSAVLAHEIRRRGFLVGSAGLAVVAAFDAAHPDRAHATVARGVSGPEDPFTLGIASGDPLPDAVVIWTRLAPSPYEVDGGLRPIAHPVQWVVAEDPQMARVVRRGTALAHPEHAHSVHVDVRGLEPNREYWYQFRSGKYLSVVGRTKTAPAPGSRLDSLNLVVASCQSWGAGWYHVWKDAASEPADLVYFAGDYIYEYPIDSTSVRAPQTPVLPEDYARQTDTLDRFRQQYGLYKTDPDLQEAHRVSPWMVTWDDHEVVNDYDAMDPALFQLRANGYRAFWEHMPLRPPQAPRGHRAVMHRRLTYGDLVRFHVLDTRQFRTTQFPGGAIGDISERRDPARQMLGVEQEAWLLDGLGSGGTTWDALANTVLFSRLDSDETEGERFSTGQWDAYQAAQQRVIDTVIDKDVDGFVVLTGDIHRNYHLNVLADFDDPASRPVGVEFAGSSVSSGRDGGQTDAGLELRKRANPHLVSADLWRGYLRCRISHEKWVTEVRAIDRISTPTYTARTSQTLVTLPGAPGIQVS
ncbi:alkaline phosphatase D family protein [Knoellia locipacati]|uniref:alkaline phosphatase D family protein n=1 Tax=Knoellia locipacati TaxID=882824 RepID=UPI00384FA1FD